MILEAVAALENSDEFTDMTLTCSDGELRAHSLIMGLTCGLVQEKAKAGPVGSVDCKPYSIAQVKIVRRFAYTGAIDLQDPSDSIAVCALALQLKMPRLRLLVEGEAIGRFLTSSTACQYLSVGVQQQSGALEGAARDYIRKHTAAVLSSDGVFDLPLPLLLSVVKDGELSCREEDLFRTVLAWADTAASKQYKEAQQRKKQAEEAKEAQAAQAAAAASAPAPVSAEPPAAAAATATAAEPTPATAASSTEAPVSSEPTAAATPAAPTTTSTTTAATPAAAATVAVAAAAATPQESPLEARKRIRRQLLDALLPHIRFPLMGAHVFARTVLPLDLLPVSAANSLLAYYIAPDMSASKLVHSAVQRSGQGSKFTWARSNSAKEGVIALSSDCRTLHFRAADAAAPAEGGAAASGAAAPTTAVPVVSEQSFYAGVQVVYVTTWGLSTATVGVVVSDSDDGEGDCSMMAADAVASAGADAAAFEGVTLHASQPLHAAPAADGTGATPAGPASAPASEGATPGPASSASTATAATAAASASGEALLGDHTHSAKLQRLTTASPAAAAAARLQDGSSLVLTVDYELKTLTVAIHHKGSPQPVPVARIGHLPPRPLRVALAAVPVPSCGDVDGIATISSRPPLYLQPRVVTSAAAAAAAAATAATPSKVLTLPDMLATPSKA